MKFAEFPSHHAILLTTYKRKESADSLWGQISSLSPAHRYFDQTVLDMETARAIISWAQTPYHQERVALISFHTAGLPAQNAMLKMLEEPHPGVRFILVVTDVSTLLETVLSRLLYIKTNEEAVDADFSARTFLSTSFEERTKLPFVQALLTKEDEEGRKDREAVKNFILSLAAFARERKIHPRYSTQIVQTASYASDPSASGKALIEYLSLLLPVIK